MIKIWYYYPMDDIQSKKMRAVGALAVLVIAILTIFFTFLNAREKKNTSLILRMFYSDMAQTLQFSMNTNGAPGEWGWHGGYKNADLINNYLANYLRVSENCVKDKGSCFPDINYKNLNEKPTSINLSKLPSIKLHNGISIAVESISSCRKKNSPCALVYVDINGIEEPNMFGRDLFVFMIVNSNSVPFLPYNSRIPQEQYSDNKKYGCNKTSDIAMYCSALIYSKGWTIDKTYPW